MGWHQAAAAFTIWCTQHTRSRHQNRPTQPSAAAGQTAWQQQQQELHRSREQQRRQGQDQQEHQQQLVWVVQRGRPLHSLWRSHW